MKTPILVPGLLLTALCACASTEAPVSTAAPAAPEATDEATDEPVATDATPAEEAGIEATVVTEASYQATAPQSDPPRRQKPQRRSTLSDVSQRMFQDPEFQRRFVESYIAETEIEPTVTTIERDRMLKVLDMISANQLEGAAVQIESDLDEATSAVFDFTLANIRYQQERYEEATDHYQGAVRKKPKFRRAWGNLGQVQFLNGNFDEAMKSFVKVIELGGGTSVIYGLLGVCHSKMDDSISAESAFRMATLLDPDTVDWKMGIAESFFKQERFADAAALFGQLIAAQPARAELWLAQGEAYARLNRPMDAAENFEMVDRLGGSSADSLNNLGDLYANEELFDLAVSAYLRALATNPESSLERPIRAAKFLSGNGAFADSRALVEGIEAARGELLDDEERKQLLRIRARLALAEGASDEEAKVLEQIVELDPLDGDALILLGQHARRSGDVEQAIFYFERASSLEAFEADAKVRHAQLLVAESRYPEALPLLRSAQQIRPRDNVQKYLEQVERVARSR